MNQLSNNLVLSCCGNLIDENWKYKGHCRIHLSKNEKIPCIYPSCNSVFSTESNLTRHISTQHPNVPKFIVGLEAPPATNIFEIVKHNVQNDLPSTRNIFSLPVYKQNPISEKFIDDLNELSRSETNEIAERMVNELDQEVLEQSDNSIDHNLLECSFENILDEEREQAANFFDHFSSTDQLSQFQQDLADGYNRVKDNNIITDTAIKAACNMVIDVLHKNQHVGPLLKEHATRIINSDHFLQKRRNSTPYRCKDFGSDGKVYYFDIQNYLKEMVKNDLIWSKLMDEKHKVRDPNVIETIHDLERIKEEDSKMGAKEINVFYSLWFDDFNTSTKTFGTTNLSTVLLT